MTFRNPAGCRYTLYNHYDLAKPDASVIYRGELMIDPLRRRVTMAGEEITLQRREFKLLQHFAENPGIVLTSDQIGELLWGAEYDYNRKLSPVIAELRRKIRDTNRPPTYIETVHGVVRQTSKRIANFIRFLRFSVDTGAAEQRRVCMG